MRVEVVVSSGRQMRQPVRRQVPRHQEEAAPFMERSHSFGALAFLLGGELARELGRASEEHMDMHTQTSGRRFPHDTRARSQHIRNTLHFPSCNGEHWQAMFT